MCVWKLKNDREKNVVFMSELFSRWLEDKLPLLNCVFPFVELFVNIRKEEVVVFFSKLTTDLYRQSLLLMKFNHKNPWPMPS